MSILGRRPVLTGGLGLVGLGAVGWSGSLAVCSATGSDLTGLLRPIFVVLDDIREFDRVGAAYLAKRGPDQVLREIFQRREFAGATLMVEDTARRAYLTEIIRSDFVSGDIVLADRWIAARAEAQIAAAWKYRPS